MSVYVDGLTYYATGAALSPPGFLGRHWCHMTADTPDELHTMADRIGLKRQWFQDHPRHPHYDLVASKRGLALRHGALERTAREMVG